MNGTCLKSLSVSFLMAIAYLSIAAEPISRVLPPPGIEIAAKDRETLRGDLHQLQSDLAAHRDHPLAPDVEIFAKAVDYGLRHGEFYQPQDVNRFKNVLKQGQERMTPLNSGTTPWTKQNGRVVRGYRSRVDDSVQPYGLDIPRDLDFDKPVPLYVWLHGRGDKQTDVHFIHDRLSRDGQIQPPGAIVLHPFGRHCLGFKSAGEIDVLEAIEHVQQHYRIDPDRIVLMGFSMGGAGAWHLGAHYTDRFVAISPGAGFVETAQYTNLKPENYPPRYEQLLWGLYDVPDYVRNLFNRPVIAYSGEVDKQKQAADMMEAAFRQQGRVLTHIIGPGMGHKYHPDSLKDILAQLATTVAKGRPKSPAVVALQTRTLRYSHMDWVEALRMGEHWRNARVDATIANPGSLRVTTENIVAMRLSPWPSMAGSEINIDGEKITVPADTNTRGVELVRAKSWRLTKPHELSTGLAKRPGLQGPIDDAFLEPFLVVRPSTDGRNPAIQAWIDAELAHFLERWRLVFRGEVRLKSDIDVTDDDIARFHLVVWGIPASNSVLQRAFNAADISIPIRWNDDQVTVGAQSWPAKNHLPVFVFPNPLNPNKYLVVNSGPTFREGHDRTNSLQNPKLPDWAVIDISQPPSATAPGHIVAADFFNELWQLK